MESSEELAGRIISRSGIVGSAWRREASAELRAHLEDLADELRAAGMDERAIEESVSRRFGEPQKIAREFADVYRAERVAAYAGTVVAMLLVSLATVGLVISTLQLFIARASHGSIAAAFAGLPWEAIGFAALTWGYSGIYVAERFFERYRLVGAVAVHFTLFATVALILHSLAPGRGAAAAVAFVCAAMVRILQRTNVRFIWCAGTAVPLLVAWIWAGPLIQSSGQLASWQMAWMVWMGMTLSCAAMTLLAKFFDREIFPRLYVRPEN